MTWDEHAIQTLKELVAQGLSASLIAKEMGTTRNAVLGKLWRLNIQRTSPVQRSNRKRGPSKTDRVKACMVTMTFPPEMHAAVSEISKRNGVSFSQTVRELVDCGLYVEATLA